MTFDEATRYAAASFGHMAARNAWMREPGEFPVRYMEHTPFGPVITEVDPRSKQKRSGVYTVNTEDRFAKDWIPVTSKMFASWQSRFVL